MSKEAQRGGLRRGWTVRLRADRPTEPVARQMGLTSWVCSLVVRQALKNPQSYLLYQRYQPVREEGEMREDLLIAIADAREEPSASRQWGWDAE